MMINEYLEEMKNIQENILYYLDEESNIEEKYQTLKTRFNDIQIHSNKYKISSLMHLLLHLSNNHHREENFFNKIEEILKLFKKDLPKHYSNSELFNIFKGNKRILLFLVEEKVINFDEFVVSRIMEGKYFQYKYPQYFQPEIKPLINEKWFLELFSNFQFEDLLKELPADFYEKRKIGEHEEEICKMIQKDLIEEFIIYVNKNCYPLNSVIKQSIYETNKFLLRNQRNELIEYAAFFGSIQIFKYLISNGIEMKSSLWLYAIHGKDPEIIKILEENQIKPKDELYKEILKESIKSHHINVSNYILDNYLSEEKENFNEYTMINALHYYNFIFIEKDKINETLFYYLCKYDYYILVLNLLKLKDIDINDAEIYNIIF